MSSPIRKMSRDEWLTFAATYRRLDGDYDAVATELGIPKSTVIGRVQKIRRLLKDKPGIVIPRGRNTSGGASRSLLADDFAAIFAAPAEPEK